MEAEAVNGSRLLMELTDPRADETPLEVDNLDGDFFSVVSSSKLTHPAFVSPFFDLSSGSSSDMIFSTDFIPKDDSLSSSKVWKQHLRHDCLYSCGEGRDSSGKFPLHAHTRASKRNVTCLNLTNVRTETKKSRMLHFSCCNLPVATTRF